MTTRQPMFAASIVALALILSTPGCAPLGGPEATAEPGRAQILKTYRESQRAFAVRDLDAIMATFAEDITFTNSALAQPIRGREALRAALAPRSGGINGEEWLVVEGNRLVTGWNEQPRTPPGTTPAPVFRGISTFVFDDEGLILHYEGVFDPIAMKTAYQAAAKSAAETGSKAEGR